MLFNRFDQNLYILKKNLSDRFNKICKNDELYLIKQLLNINLLFKKTQSII